MFFFKKYVLIINIYKYIYIYEISIILVSADKTIRRWDLDVYIQ